MDALFTSIPRYQLSTGKLEYSRTSPHTHFSNTDTTLLKTFLNPYLLYQNPMKKLVFQSLKKKHQRLKTWLNWEILLVMFPGVGNLVANKQNVSLPQWLPRRNKWSRVRCYNELTSGELFPFKSLNYNHKNNSFFLWISKLC